MKIILTIFCLTTLVLSSCASSKEQKGNTEPTEIQTNTESAVKGNFSRLKYYFQDASVDAQFHRSYSVSINKNGKAIYVCKSYTDTLVNKVFQISETEIHEIQQDIASMKGVKKLKFKTMSGTTAEGLDIFDSNGKQTTDAYWNNNPSESVEKLIKTIKTIAVKQVGPLGVTKYLSPLDKYILTEGAYINLSHYSDFNQLTEPMILAIQEYLANEKKNLFKQHFSLSDYYAIDEVKPKNKGIIDIIIIHKEDFRLRFEQKQKGDSLNLGNNPSGYTGTLFYDFDAKKITGMNGWE